MSSGLDEREFYGEHKRGLLKSGIYRFLILLARSGALWISATELAVDNRIENKQSVK